MMTERIVPLTTGDDRIVPPTASAPELDPNHKFEPKWFGGYGVLCAECGRRKRVHLDPEPWEGDYTGQRQPKRYSFMTTGWVFAPRPGYEQDRSKYEN